MSKPKPDHHSKNTGPGKATGIIPNDKEFNKRVRQAANLICSGYRRSEIVEAMHTEYGVHWRTIDRWLVRARELLMEELGKPKEEHRADVLGEYQTILRTKEAAHSDKLQALKGKREMLGLDAPKRTEISGTAGGPIQTQEVEPKLTPDRWRDIVNVLESDDGEKTQEPTGNGEARSSGNGAP